MSEITSWANTVAGNAVAFDDIDNREGRPRAQVKHNFKAMMAAISRFAATVGGGISAKAYGATGDGVTNDTTNFQTAINAAVAAGVPLLVPAGTYLVSGLTVPAGRAFIYMHQNAELKAAVASITVLSFVADAGRLNQKFMSGGVINGNSLANVIGIGFDGTGINALLYTRVNDTYIKYCYEGFAGRNVQELILDGVICYGNTVGGTIESTSVGGGGTVLGFRNCRFQDNTIGFVGISSSIYPVGGWLFQQCTFQSNLICGAAFFGAVSGNAQITSIQMINAHFEGNGSSGVTTLTVRTRVIKRSGSYIVGSSVFMDGCEAGESVTAVTSQLLETGSTLELRNCVSGGGLKTQVSCDATSVAQFSGRTTTTGLVTGVIRWEGLNYVPASGSGGTIVGLPLIVPINNGRNLYYGTGLNPDVPEATGVITATASKVFDADHGQVQQVAYTSAAGGFGVNRVAFSTHAAAVAIGDMILVSVLVWSATATTLGMTVSGSSTLLTTSVPIQVGWQRVAFYEKAAIASAAGYELVVYPIGTDAPTIRFAKMHSDRVAVGGDVTPINRALRLGYYDNQRPVLYATGIPTTGTFTRGTRIINSAPAVGSARAWAKVTTGAANVLATDWINEGNL